jgi:hypothetical protein
MGFLLFVPVFFKFNCTCTVALKKTGHVKKKDNFFLVFNSMKPSYGYNYGQNSMAWKWQVLSSRQLIDKWTKPNNLQGYGNIFHKHLLNLWFLV